ncbi:MAG: DUF3078 domain-containing protein [Tannerella sp.]|jgi:hypothetical protein|nr:DUF3078 domain-containing protein [Tannerella sp.]
MDKVKSVILPLLLMIFNVGINAQTNQSDSLPPEVMAWTKSTLNTFSYKHYKSLKDAIIDNDFYIPMVFKGGIFPKLNFNTDFSLPKLNLPSPYSLGDKQLKSVFSSYLIQKSHEEEAYKEMLKDPSNFKYTIEQLPGAHIKSESIDKSENVVKLAFKPTQTVPEKQTVVSKFAPNRRYWTMAYQNNVQFTRNKSSKNWGNIDNMTLYIYNLLNYNYARDRITLTNELKTTHNINNAPNDTVHKYVFGIDELRIYSTFGIKAIGHWSYSASGTFTSRVFNTYKTNTEVKTSGFLAPFNVNMGLGMTFATTIPIKTPNRAFSISATINPLSFDYNCSTDSTIALGTYSDGSKQHVIRRYGSTVDIKNSIRFNKSVTLDSHVNYFTNYEYIRCDFDSKLNITLSRYFSTMLQVFLNFDDSRKLTEDEKILRMKEVFTFGFAYKW